MTHHWIYLCLFQLIPLLSIGQINTGTWMLNGSLQTETVTEKIIESVKPTPETSILLAPEISFFVAPRWMVHVNLGLNIDDRYGQVSKGIGMRYYLKSNEKYRMFVGARMGWNTARALIPGAGGSNVTFFKSKLDFGINRFLNKNVAWETLVIYSFYNERRDQGVITRRGAIANDGIQLQWQMQYFFESKLSTDSVSLNRAFKKGMWLIGGHIKLGGGQFNLLFTQGGIPNENEITPFLAYFFGPHLAVGAYLNYWDNAGYSLFYGRLTPMARYYINLNRKRKLFGELGVGFGLAGRRVSEKIFATENEIFSRTSLGLANMLSPFVSFDIKVGYEQRRINKFTRADITINNFMIELGLQAYFD